MAEAKVKNEVHENAIWIERVEKETFHAKPTTVCNPNPRQKYFDGAEKLKTNKSGKVTFKELISKFDTMKYHRESCSSEFPSVNILAKVHFSSMLNAGFQERVFSTCGFVQGMNQGQLTIDHMEMKALLMQNADLIRQGVI